MKVTVVIPHLNAAEELERCLAALAAEHEACTDLSVIVVDNGSTVPPEAECAPYPFVQLVSEPQPGPGPARSRGARLARTEIVAFVDADCRVVPGWAAAILEHFKRSPVPIIGGDVRIALQQPKRGPSAIEAYESVYGYRMKLYIERDGYTATCNMAVRRDTFLRVGDFGGISIAEDMDWGRRAKSLGLSIAYVPQMCVMTPARSSFRSLARKWDRHIAHDFAAVSGTRSKMRWALRALALAVSPVVEAVRIIRSDRLSGVSPRLRAFLCLVGVRLYRAGRMMTHLRGTQEGAAAAWRNG